MPKAKFFISWMLFAFVCSIYVISMPETITFWDSPEFISSSYTLQATHPPGAPFYTLLTKLILSFFPATMAAYVGNLISAVFGALTITLLFRIVLNISEKVLSNIKSNLSTTLPIISGIISALTLAFSDSFWTASTETEVYTLSFALMAGMLHIMILWERTNSLRKETILLLFLALLLGISTSVHLINIAIVIPLSILIAHKKFGLNFKTFFLSIILGCIAFFCIYGFVVQGSIKLANKLDIWLVNSFKLPLNTGILLSISLLSLLFLAGLIYSQKQQKSILHHVILGMIFFFIGMSSFFMPMQRANVNTLVADKIENSNKMLQYVRAEQFGVGSIPLLKGPVFNAPLDKDNGFLDGEPFFTYDAELEKYVEIHDGKFKIVNYADEFNMFFPRMFDKGDAEKYKAWTPIYGEPISYPVQGETVTINKPTFGENIRFFMNYQVFWLNLRYLYWNFIGRQNDHQGLGYIKDGNWISGINAIDKHRVGDASLIPEYYKNHKSNDAYYFLPFILGILGLISLWKYKPYFWTTLLLFLTFGIGITMYVNPVPSSILVRERDYIFIGSFVIFALWVGLSILFFFKIFQFIKDEKVRITTIGIIAFMVAPGQLLAKGWDNHQRSHENFAYYFGKAYLDACPKQAILITNGDNMTFPLWYLQQVEGYRTDVRVINFDQLNIDTHIENLKKQLYDSKPLKFSLYKDFYVNGVEKLIPLQEEIKEAAKLPVLLNFLQTESTYINWNGRMRPYVPSTSFSIPIDTLQLPKVVNPEEVNASFTEQITWSHPKKFYGLNEIVLMDLLTNNIHERTICFVNNGKKQHLIGLESYLIQHGMVHLLAPIQRTNPEVNPKIVATEMNYRYIMETINFEGLNDADTFVRSEHQTYVREILRPQYYFLAQALLEEGKTDKALQILETCVTLFPNETIPFKQFSFAIGKLYVRAGKTEKGIEICTVAMQNIWNELQWMTSFDPPYPIINLRHAYRLKNMYAQMMRQFPKTGKQLPISNENFQQFDAAFQTWQKRNWPY